MHTNIFTIPTNGNGIERGNRTGRPVQVGIYAWHRAACRQHAFGVVLLIADECR